VNRQAPLPTLRFRSIGIQADEEFDGRSWMIQFARDMKGRLAEETTRRDKVAARKDPDEL
jgi:hypothetical protein